MLYLHVHFVSYAILKRDSNCFFPHDKDSLEQRLLLCLGCVILSTAEYFLIFTLYFSLKPLSPKLDRVFLKPIQQSHLAPELYPWSHNISNGLQGRLSEAPVVAASLQSQTSPEQDFALIMWKLVILGTGLAFGRCKSYELLGFMLATLELKHLVMQSNNGDVNQWSRKSP